ncbi:MAG: AAA family ATPase [Desulfomicrobium sp.]
MSALVKDFAKLALDRGLHPLACNADKTPAINREKIKDRPPTWKEIERWGNPMVALVCGNEVNPVLAIDFDQAGLFFDPYRARVIAERPELWARLTTERSMNGGYHIWIRTKRPFMTQKLAHQVIEVGGPGEYDGDGKPIDPDNRPKKSFKAFEYRGKWVIAPDAIETRGATSGMGAYCLCAPSPGYVLIQGKILSMPLVEDEEVDYLLSLAREFETYFPEPKERRIKPEARAADGNRPGDDFNARGESLPILEKHGWTVSKEVGDRTHLARPGKTGCTSATLTADGIFYPFSSNSHPFEPNEAYSPFSVYAMLEHDGDFAAAAKGLSAQGYGSVSPSQSPRGETVRQPLKVLNFHEFLALELPVRGNVLFPVLPQQGLVMLYAPRGVGKTWVSLNMAWAAASCGLCIGGWSADRAWKVIYIDGEMPAAVLQERLALVAQGAGGDCDPDYLKILTPDIQESGMPNLATPDGRAALEPYIADREVIIVDNLATLSRGGRENEAESWLPMQEWCLDMRRRGKSVVLIHHAGKSGQQRGTSAREDILDTVISLRKAKDYEPNQGAKFEVHLEKARGITGKDAEPFAAELIEAPGGGVTWACVPIQDERESKVKALLAEGLAIADIVEETGIPRATVYRIKKRLGVE